ncbi:MAG: hypothetical protein KAU20_07635 [Nanoarchaeota archaeon]|nr:hypothetical protein [Nanoarchaeota archaeon]
MIVRELITKLGYDLDKSKIAEFDRSIGMMRTKLEGTTRNLKAVADGFLKVGTRLSLFVSLPLAILGAVSVKAASAAEETRNKFQVVFRDIREEAEETVDVLSKSYGLGDDSARKLLSTTGDLLKGFGFTQKEALDLSRRVNTLAVDLTSFNDIQGGAERASMALTKGLLGERESMKLLGIQVNENTPRFKELIALYQRTQNASLMQAKALATLQMSYDQSKDAIGDWERTQRSLANQMRLLPVRFKDVRIEIGKMLIDTLKLDKVIEKLNLKMIEFKEWLETLAPHQKRFLVWITLAVIAIPPLLIAIGVAIKLFLFLKTTLLLVKVAFFGAAGAAGTFNLAALLIPILIIVAIAALILFIDELIVWAKGGETIMGGFFDKVAGWVKQWTTFWEQMGGTLQSWLSGNEERLAEHLEYWKEFFKWIFDQVAKASQVFAKFILGEDLFKAMEKTGAFLSRTARGEGAVGRGLTRFQEQMQRPDFGQGIVESMIPRMPVPTAAAASAGVGQQNITQHISLSFGDFMTPTPVQSREDLADYVTQKVSQGISKEMKKTVTANPVQER